MIIYGQTVYGFSRFHGVSEEEAEEVISGWFRAYPRAKRFLSWVVANAYDCGYVETMFGRKRRLHRYLYSGEPGMMAYGERMAMNAPVQGSAADMIKMAMLAVSPVCKQIGAIQVGTIHDEIMFFTPEGAPDEDILLLKTTMEQASDIGVPVVCDASIQTRWGQQIRAL